MLILFKQNKQRKKTMNNNDILNVAKTIKSQIHPKVLMCSAARNFAAFENEIGMYGIQFKISNTSKYKFATVRITLNGHDLYNIEIKNIRGRIVDSKTDIYCDQLSSILESMWEKKEILNRWTKKELKYA
jgi:hypothetical protein